MDGANSEDTESFHNWSTNSRWLVVSSRRDDGLFTRPYFCHVDTDGKVTKAFMLPQRNPRQFYRGRFMSFSGRQSHQRCLSEELWCPGINDTLIK